MLWFSGLETKLIYAPRFSLTRQATFPAEVCVTLGVKPRDKLAALHATYQVPKSEALFRLRQFLESGEVETESAAAVMATPNLASAKPGFIDRLILSRYAREEARRVSFETAATKLNGAKVLS
jgi:hypothetical protein